MSDVQIRQVAKQLSDGSLVAAHKAGMAYYERNKPTATDLATVARSTGWHGELESVWLAGYFGAKARDQGGRL